MQYKKSKEERQRGKNSMNDAQLRRRELLRQTKQLYGERETVPPIHPRYGNLCKEQDEGGEEAGGSFYMRLVICIPVSYTHLGFIGYTVSVTSITTCFFTLAGAHILFGINDRSVPSSLYSAS